MHRQRVTDLVMVPTSNEGRQVEKQIIELTARIVSAHVSTNDVSLLQLPGLIREVHQALLTAGDATVEAIKPAPAIDPKKSVFADRILCLGCGASLKMLKRHLGAEHQMTPAEYREKWGLPASYPMVASEYAASRSKLATESGLGRKAEAQVPKKKRVGRPKKN